MESLGAVAPILATASRTERATQRAARELIRRQRELGIEPKPNDGTAATPAELERLTACHRSDYRRTDWSELAAREPVPLPQRTQEREKAARRALATWRPSWQERMFGDETQRRRQLNAKVFEAAREDEIAFQKALRAAQAYNAEALMARKLFELDAKAVKDAVTLKSRLSELRAGMNSLGVAVPGGGRLVAVVEAVQEADIPYERLAESAGRQGMRDLIPPAERRRIHLAAVCAAGLRVGGELVSLLPLEAVEVVVNCEPAAAAGRAPPEPVLQLLVTRKSLTAQDWKTADAITLATALGARMDWSIENGFAPIRIVALSAMGRPLAATA